MLHDPERHEPLISKPWDPSAVRAAIGRVVRDTESRFDAESFWPPFPDEAGALPDFALYAGAAGVVWALHHLEGAGAAPLTRSYAGYVDAILACHRTRRATAKSDRVDAASYLVGDTGILLVRCAIGPDAEAEAEIDRLVASNYDHPSSELMWGEPGTMLAALLMHRQTGEPRWKAHFLRGARTVRNSLERSDRLGCFFWTPRVAGRPAAYLGGVHGFAGNAFVLLAGRDLLDAADRAFWERAIVETVQRTAHWEGSAANWPPLLDEVGGTPHKVLMQFCHGAPGIVACVAGHNDNALADVLEAAGEAIWAAGPLRKGSNLCHGTGGSGYAFLKLFARTGDERWLDRARAFAMHGIFKIDDDRRQYGHGRFSLWTGDLGFAIYLLNCIDATAAIPTLDTFFLGSR